MSEPIWTEQSIVGEEHREYIFAGRTYRVEQPRKVYTLPDGALECVEDSAGVVHAVPAPGVNGCVRV